MEIYETRNAEFKQLVTVNDWRVKVYTITHRESFGSEEVLKNAISNLSIWLESAKISGFKTYKTAFLIVHEGRDGVWSLTNWWLDGGILQSMTFFTNFDKPNDFRMFPEKGFMSCVWEMAVINFEREKWIECVLKKAKKPDFTGYLEETLSRKI